MIDEEKLLLYSSGELDPGEAETIERLLAEDAEAADYLCELESLDREIKELSYPEPSASALDRIIKEDLKKRRSIPVIPLASVAAVILAGLFVALIVKDQKPHVVVGPPKTETQIVSVSVKIPETIAEEVKTKPKRRLSERLFTNSSKRFSNLRSSRERRSQFRRSRIGI